MFGLVRADHARLGLVSPGDAWRGQGPLFARLSHVLGAVAQSGSAPRSHRGGQGFKSPQLHRVLAGQSRYSIFWRLAWEPLREPSCRLQVWLGLRAVATAKTASTSTRVYCRDSAHHKTCSGRWRGVVSLGFDADGKRIRTKVSGKTRTAVKDKLRSLHCELDAGLRSTAAYTVEKAVADWLAEGPPGRTAKTVEVRSSGRSSGKKALQPRRDDGMKSQHLALATGSRESVSRLESCLRAQASNRSGETSASARQNKRAGYNKRIKLAPVRLSS